MQVPEPVGRVVDGAGEATLRRYVGSRQGRRERLGVGARVVGELDGDGLEVAIGNRIVQVLDSALRFAALVEANEAHSLGNTWRQRNVRRRNFGFHNLLYLKWSGWWCSSSNQTQSS